MTSEKNKFLIQLSMMLINFILGLISVWLIAEINYFHDQYRLTNQHLQQLLQIIQPTINDNRFRHKSKLEQDESFC